jgi:hypothetical protein
MNSLYNLITPWAKNGSFGLNESMEQSPSWEVTSLSASQENHLLWNMSVHCRVHKSLPLVPIPSHVFLADILAPF